MKQRALPLILAATIPCAGCTSSATAPSATTPPSTPATAPPRTSALESSSADSAAPGLHAARRGGAGQSQPNRSHSYGSLSIIVKSLMSCES
jgi:hypothetical protein